MCHSTVSEFAKLTGDFRCLSAVDLRVLALTYQLEKEHCGIDHIKTRPTKQVRTWFTHLLKICKKILFWYKEMIKRIRIFYLWHPWLNVVWDPQASRSPCSIDISLDVSINTWLTLNKHLNQQLAHYWLNVDQLIWINWHTVVYLQILVDSLLTLTEMLIKCQQRCPSTVDWGYQLTLDCGYLKYTWSKTSKGKVCHPSHKYPQDHDL